MRMSSGPQDTEWRSCCIAFVTIRPRQLMGVVSMGGGEEVVSSGLELEEEEDEEA